MHDPPANATWMHPVGGTHESVVQSDWSSQFVGPPGLHDPPAHVSPEVQGLLSVHGAVLFAKTQPVVGPTQVSVVQTLLSLQTTAL